MTPTFGVGFLGAGAVTQAIHLPALRGLDALAVRGFMDVDLSLAAHVAQRFGAFAVSDEDALIEDPRIDVVVVGSPDRHHARQIEKACSAGKKVVLAEKPLVTDADELTRVTNAAHRSGTHIVVGAMHAYDTAVRDALDMWSRLAIAPITIEVTAFLGQNSDLVELATEPVSADPEAASDAPVPTDREVLRQGVLGLASHDIPIVRALASEPPTLFAATRLHPWGYSLVGFASGSVVSYVGLMSGEWMPSWRLQATAERHRLAITFPTPYVLAAGCRATVTTPDVSHSWRSAESPYVEEWREVCSLLRGAQPTIDLARAAADAAYAFALVDQLPGVVG